MEGDDGTSMSTMTASNDDDPCSAVELKPLNSIWDCAFMKKDINDKNWTCGHCNVIYSKINATKALAHLLSIPDSHIAACKAVIPRKYLNRYTDLYNKLSAISTSKK